MNLSVCCKVGVKLVGGMPEDGDEGTRYYVCLKCNKACAIFARVVMDFPRPKGWRKGKTIYEFLRWLRFNNLVPREMLTYDADTYKISDSDWDKWFEEFLEENNGK